MDVFYSSQKLSDDELWKNSDLSKKKIIYAPHHSIGMLDYCSSKFSTFDKNYRFMLNMARKYSGTTTWIYKPHPNLKKTVVMAGVFNSEQEYEEYLKEWNNLPNAKTVMEGSYVDYFKTSDAMICDSVSFLAEYQFTGKPLLLLTRPEQRFNEFGEQIQSILYKAPGDSYDEIERFITEIVINGNDTMRNERQEFFVEKLDYMKRNGNIGASEKIFQEICKLCFNE